MTKAKWSVKCSGRHCEAIIRVDTLCLKTEGSLTVPLNQNDAVHQDFYFCPQEVCLSIILIWLNAWYLKSVDADTGIANGGKNDVARDLDIAVI